MCQCKIRPRPFDPAPSTPEADSGEEDLCAVHAYVLMSNHVHLLMTPAAPDAIGKVMQSFGRQCVRYVNDVHRRTGTRWEGRYKAAVIDSDEYLLTCYRRSCQ